MRLAWAAGARILARGCAALFFMIAASPAWAEARPLRFGLWPYHSPAYLVRYYEDLARHLQSRLGREVDLQTAPSVDVFMQRVFKGEYDIALIGPHFGRLAQTDYRWQPVAGYKGANPVYIVTLKQSKIRKASDLKGKTLATPGRTLLLSLTAGKWLKSRGLSERDYRWLEIGGLASSVYTLLAGEADAAVTTLASLSMNPQAELDQLHILGEAGSNPQLYIFAAPSLKAREIQVLRQAGREYVQGGRQVLADISSKELQSMDEFSSQIRQYYRNAGHEAAEGWKP
jgi:phosphonate transport system substrate-binding protein